MITARLRARLAGAEDAGFALVFVMLVTMLITIGVTSVLVVTASNIVPAKSSQDSDTAYAAAESGIADYIAFLNQSCATFNSSRCAAINSTQVSATVQGTDNAGTETYVRTVLNPTTYLTDGFLRVESTGTAGSRSRTLVADISGLPNVLRYSYLSNYETLSSTYLKSYYGARSIKITRSDSAAAADSATSAVHDGDTVTWQAPTATGSGGVDICDRVWYDDSVNPLDPDEANPVGAGSDPAYKYPGRGTLKTYWRTTVPPGMDWKQTGSDGTFWQPCEVTFTSGMTFNGPVYTRDAAYLSYGTASGTGPTFAIPAGETLPPVSTGWSTTSYPAGFSSQLYRQFPYVLGGPSSSSSVGSSGQTVQHSAYDLKLPATPTVASSACIYSGPTRVVFSGSTATVTSPQTTSALGTDAGCYPTGGYSNGIVQYSFNYTQHGGGIIYVKNDHKPSGGFATTAQTASSTPSAGNTVFYLTNSSTSGTLDHPSVSAPDSCSSSNTYTGTAASPTCAWSGTSNSAGGSWQPDGSGWTKYTANTDNLNTCPTDATDRLTFECEFNNGSVGTSHDYYSILRQRIKDAMSRSSYGSSGSGCNATFNPQTATATQLGCLVQYETRYANTGGATANSTPPSNGKGHQYVATTSQTTTTSTQAVSGATTPSAPISNDELFTTTSGSGATETVTTTKTVVTMQRETERCSLLGVGNACIGTWSWGNDVPQFQMTVTQKTYSNLAASAPTVSYFPNMDDVTQYATGGSSSTIGPGDLYVEGTGISGKATVVADDDVVVTGPLKTTMTQTTNAFGEPALASGGALSVVATDNVRVYHPVGCAVTDSTTSPGYCANDITGLYSGNLETAGTLSATHPALQYCNMTTGHTSNTGNSNCSGVTATGTGAVTEIDAAVFALTGSLLTDNYNRGTPMTDLSVVGGIYESHRGATGQQWETQTDDTSRAGSGYVLQDSYLDLETAGLPYVPDVQSGSSARAWNVVSISAASV